MSNFDSVRANIYNTKFILCDISANMCHSWDVQFNIQTNLSYKNISICHMLFDKCIDTLREEYPDSKIAIVSPANSYGLMDGGYDKAITDYFGKNLQSIVQQKILHDFCGEQPVGCSISVDIPNHKNFMLIHTPTMRKPERILDNKIVYHCTRSSIIEALINGCDIVVLPAFGGLTGEVSHTSIAYYMERAIAQLITVPYNIPNWRYVYDSHPLNQLKNM